MLGPEVVILAAGRSSRMGEPKGLVMVGAKHWIEHQLDVVEKTGGTAVVVLGFDCDKYDAALPGLSKRAKLACNPDPERGPFSSLQCGLAQILAGAPVYVLPIDVPAPDPHVWRALFGALGPDLDAAVPVYDDRGGHPVLLSAHLVARLLTLPATSRLDAELAVGRVARVPVDDARVRMNLNVPEDWGKLGMGA